MKKLLLLIALLNVTTVYAVRKLCPLDTHQVSSLQCIASLEGEALKAAPPTELQQCAASLRSCVSRDSFCTDLGGNLYKGLIRYEKTSRENEVTRELQTNMSCVVEIACCVKN